MASPPSPSSSPSPSPFPAAPFIPPPSSPSPNPSPQPHNFSLPHPYSPPSPSPSPIPSPSLSRSLSLPSQQSSEEIPSFFEVDIRGSGVWVGVAVGEEGFGEEDGERERERHSNHHHLPEEEEEEEELENHSVFTQERIAYCCGLIFKPESVLGLYLSVFLMDVVGVRPSLVGTLLLIKQIWDAITDPIVGSMSDQTATSWGRRKPWILAGAPPLFISWIMLWTIPGFLDSPRDSDKNPDDFTSFLYYLFCLLLVTTCLTCITTPYVALFQDIAPYYHVRTKLVAMGEFFSFIGNVLTLGMMGLILYQNEDHIEDGYFLAALIFAPFLSFSRVIACLFIPEAPVEHDEDSEERKKKKGPRQFISLLKESYKALFFKDFALLCCNGVCAGGLVSMLTSNLLLYVKYYLGEEKYSTPILLSLTISIGLCIPLWVWVLKKVGKKNACFIGIGPTMLIFLAFIFVQPGQAQLVFFLCILLGCGASCFIICINSMQPDVVHAYMKQTSVRNEGVMYSLFQLAFKIGFAIGISASSFVLDMTGFVGDQNQTGVEQNEATKLALQIMTFTVPGILCGIAMIFLCFITDYREEFGEHQHKGKDQEKETEKEMEIPE